MSRPRTSSRQRTLRSSKELSPPKAAFGELWTGRQSHFPPMWSPFLAGVLADSHSSSSSSAFWMRSRGSVTLSAAPRRTRCRPPTPRTRRPARSHASARTGGEEGLARSSCSGTAVDPRPATGKPPADAHRSWRPRSGGLRFFGRGPCRWLESGHRPVRLATPRSPSAVLAERELYTTCRHLRRAAPVIGGEISGRLGLTLQAFHGRFGRRAVRDDTEILDDPVRPVTLFRRI
jgi:hypothetical protein